MDNYQFTILIGAYKKGRVWTPVDARKTAGKKRAELIAMPARGSKYEIKL